MTFNNSKKILDSAHAINANRSTIAATWDLQKPSRSEPAISLRAAMRRNEGLTDADRRVRVFDRDAMPGGPYQAICKFNPGYVNSTDEEYLGTGGWVISEDIVVTAGL
ncbi:Fc.00g000840.m01.CDS01 [Cosmosporella sp. VM-42]